jgi:prevent-host-death family protein
MKQVNIAEAKASFSRLLREVRAGESIVICEHNVPIAELRPLVSRRNRQRPLGPEVSGFEIPAAFFDPLPAELARAFEGHDP